MELYTFSSNINLDEIRQSLLKIWFQTHGNKKIFKICMVLWYNSLFRISLYPNIFDQYIWTGQGPIIEGHPGQQIQNCGLTLTMTLFDFYGNSPDNRDVFNPIIISVLKIQLTFFQPLHAVAYKQFAFWMIPNRRSNELNYRKNDFLSYFQ